MHSLQLALAPLLADTLRNETQIRNPTPPSTFQSEKRGLHPFPICNGQFAIEPHHNFNSLESHEPRSVTPHAPLPSPHASQ